MKRVAITLPDVQAEAIEQIRRQERIPRSRVIQRAVDFYLSERAHHRAIRAYEQGYLRHPEGSEMAALARVAAATLVKEDWE